MKGTEEIIAAMGVIADRAETVMAEGVTDPVWISRAQLSGMDVQVEDLMAIATELYPEISSFDVALFCFGFATGMTVMRKRQE